MTAATEPVVAVGMPSLRGTLRNAALAAWGAVIGALPHVLHHVGPLAGAAILAGAGGKAIFFAIGLVAAIPTLRRLHRRFRTWVAPATAIAVFAAMFTLSTVLIAPLVTGSGGDVEQRPGIRAPGGPAPVERAPSAHAAHHE